MAERISKYYDLNDKSVVVELIQERLVELGYLDGLVSGIYDENTRKAVIKFQQKHFPLPKNGRYVKNRMWAIVHWDGYVGQITWQYLWDKIYERPTVVEEILGRIINKLFKRISPGWAMSIDKKKQRYGCTKEEVESNLVKVWFLSKEIQIHKLHLDQILNIEKRIRRYEEKHNLEHYNLSKIRSFSWRPSRGSTEISNHSFGTAIDIYDKVPKYVRRAFKKEGARIINTHIEF